jgi:hypothetical protein
MIRPATLGDAQTIKELLQELIGYSLSAEDVVDRIIYVQNREQGYTITGYRFVKYLG